MQEKDQERRMGAWQTGEDPCNEPKNDCIFLKLHG